jgi:hypothetical protein
MMATVMQTWGIWPNRDTTPNISSAISSRDRQVWRQPIKEETMAILDGCGRLAEAEHE